MVFPRRSRTLTVALVLCLETVSSGGAWAGSPTLSGLYRVSNLGLVDFSVAGGELVGRYKGRGACEYELDARIVSGVFEGNVFVGQVLLCQEGVGCESPTAVPVLGVLADRKLTTLVKLAPGCSSRALDQKWLVFREADGDERPPPSTTAEIAARNKAKVLAAQAAVRDGYVKLKESDLRGAEQRFQRALSHDDTNAEAWLGLGEVQLRLKEPQASLATLAHALERARTNASIAALVDYNLGCAYALLGRKHEALRALREAVRLDGAVVAEGLESDPDLESLRAEREFSALLHARKR